MEEQKENNQEPGKVAQHIPIVNLQRVYANSLGIGISSSDLSITFMINGRPSHQVFLAIPTAEALVDLLQKALEDQKKSKEGLLSSQTK